MAQDLWDSIKDKVGKVAPILANAIMPGSGVALSFVANALGVGSDPEAISNALNNASSADVAKLREIEATHKERLAEIALQRESNQLAADTARIGEVNESIRSEHQAKHWWSSAWRPFWGFVSAIAFLVVVVYVSILAHMAIVKSNSDAMTMIPQLLTSITLLFSIPGAILGVSAWHRGKMQRVQAGEQLKEGLIAKVVKKVK